MGALKNVRYRYGFRQDDCMRFERAQRFEAPCDWCGLSFTEEASVFVDHDHECPCKQRLNKGTRSKGSKNSCTLCLRGFVHQPCNKEIGVLEWRERTFGLIDPRLAAYRLRFPVPRKPDTRCNKHNLIDCVWCSSSKPH